MKKMKFRTIIIFETFIVTIICMGIFVIYASYKYQNSIQKEKYEITRFYIRNVINEMDSFFAELDNMSYLAFCKEGLVENCKNYSALTDAEKVTGRSIFYEASSEIMLLKDKIYGVVLYDADGQHVYSHIFTNAFPQNILVTNMSRNQTLIDSVLEAEAFDKKYKNTKYGFLAFETNNNAYNTAMPEIYVYAVRQLRLFEQSENAGYMVLISPISVFEYFFENENNISNVLLLDESNNIVYETSGQYVGVSVEEYLPDLLNVFALKQNTYYQTIINDTEILVSGAESSYNGWKFITIQNADHVYSVSHTVTKMLAIVFVIMLLITIGLITIFISRNTKPLAVMSDYLSNMDLNHPGNEIHSKSQCKEFVTLTDAYNAMLCKLKNMLELEYKSVLREKEYQLSLLRTQVKPHFLYNTLDTIRMSSIMSKDTQTADMILCLSDFFRKSVTSKKIILLEEEFSQIESYLSLLKLRYSELTTNICLNEELRYIEIPSFVLQPLVENAFLHGLKPKKCAGTITVTTEIMEEGRYNITVLDNGVGAPEETVSLLNEETRQHQYEKNDQSVSHIGLNSVNWRLRGFFGDSYHMDISIPPNGGFCVRLIISDL